MKSKLSKFNELNVYVRDTDLAKLIAIPNGIHEIALYLKDKKKADTLAVQLQSEFPGLLIEPWSELAPELKLLQEQLQINMIILMTIIMLALIFGIINTMLMAVLERMKELGVLMAVGMNKMKVFTMIVLETIFLSVLGGPAGLLLGFLIVSYLGKVGINLSMYGEGLHDMGMNEIVRPYLPAVKYVHLSIMVMVTAVLAAIYPALRAIRLKPVDAIRKI
ncbi:MAG: FtsX-like permease family protein [Bacteroidia bacterium]|nr:FtsX-like permease family protein [Bacteroidia bacterium]